MNLEQLLRLGTVLFLLSFHSVAVETIRFPWSGHPESIKKDYYLALLELALKKTEAEFGPFKLVKFDIPVNQMRSINLLEHEKKVDLLWTMTSIEREQKLLPIRVPLVKGAMGCRIFLIRKGEQARFDNIKTLQQLKSVLVGQGSNWPDRKILEYNGFNVVHGSDYGGIFNMLFQKRFDYFPRAIHEPWHEVKLFNQLSVEKNFMLQYPAPFFFFVNKQNHSLATRIEKGLRIALADGSFEALFNSHRDTQGVFDKAKVNTRTVYQLENPFLSEQTKALFKQGGQYSLNCQNLAH